MRVILATDGSTDAALAAQWLAQFPLPPDVLVDVMTAVPAAVAQFDDVGFATLARTVRADAERLVEETRGRIAAGGPPVAGRVLDGDPREAIVTAAAAEGADLIVVGARGLGAVAQAVLGSVSLGIARHAPCPVLICKGAPRPIRTITVGLDGSTHARDAVRFVAALPLAPATVLRLVAVAEPLRYPTTAPGVIAGTIKAMIADLERDRRTALESALTAAADELRPRGIKAEVVSLTGPPAPTLVADAERAGSDLIVVGARGLGGVQRVLLGSVSETVLREAVCPVLIVRARD